MDFFQNSIISSLLEISYVSQNLHLQRRGNMIEAMYSIAFIYNIILLLRQYQYFVTIASLLQTQPYTMCSSTNPYFAGSIVALVISSHHNRKKYDLFIRNGIAISGTTIVCVYEPTKKKDSLFIKKF